MCDKATFYDLPELVGLYIVSKLNPKRKLILRQVCSLTKYWVEQDIRANNGKDFDIKVILDAETDTFTTLFINSGFSLPFLNQLHIRNRNRTPRIYREPGMVTFLERFGTGIKRLRVDFFNACADDGELAFFEGLPNLEVLEIEEILVPNALHPDPTRIPESFKNLKVLKVSGMTVTDRCLMFGYFWKLLQHCTKLETLSKPYFHEEIEGVSDHQNGNMGHMSDIIRQRQGQHGGGDIKFIDMTHMVDPDHNRYGFDFVILAETCLQSGVKLMNVDANLLDLVNSHDDGEIDDCVISLQNLNYMVKILPFENLERIDLKSLKTCCSMDDELGRSDMGLADQEWPMLNSVKVHFDIDTRNKEQRHILFETMGIILTDYDRPLVHDLTLTFERNAAGESLTETKHLPYMVQSIYESYCNLKIVGWDGLNKSFVKLWRGLNENLEELWLEDCRTLSNVCFIGRDEERPIFLKFERLKVVTLGGLDLMPKITDRSFRDVFSRMNLQEFYMISDKPLGMVTREGILSLATSTAFSKSIRKFPFKNWSLQGVDVEEFQELECRFECN